MLEEGGGGERGIAGVERESLRGLDVHIDGKRLALGEGDIAGGDAEDGACDGRRCGPGGNEALQAQENLRRHQDQEDEPDQHKYGKGAEPACDLFAGDDVGGVHGVGMKFGLSDEAGDQFRGAFEGGLGFLGNFEGGGYAFLGVGDGEIDEPGGGVEGGAMEDGLKEPPGEEGEGGPGGKDQRDGDDGGPGRGCPG